MKVFVLKKKLFKKITTIPADRSCNFYGNPAEGNSPPREDEKELKFKSKRRSFYPNVIGIRLQQSICYFIQKR